MIREIGAVLIGYIVMVALIFATFSLLYMALGTEGAFELGLYEVSTSWIVATIILNLVVAVIGGFICSVIATKPGTTKALAGIAFGMGLILAIATLFQPAEGKEIVRIGEVALMDAMNDAKEPIWITFLTPVIGAIGVLGGACLRDSKKTK